MIDEGDRIPDVQLATPNGGRVSLRDYEGKPLALYFYPKDDTSGCTRQAQDFSRLYPEFRALGVALLGVSRDAPAKHLKFIDKYDLQIPLATAEDLALLETFGAWIEKQLYGKKYMGIDRSTFLFGADGRCVRVWRRVKVPGHAVEVLEAVREIA